MMKKNIFLRTALLLLAGVWASTNLLAEATTWAKYQAAGEGKSSARFASFSFVVGSKQYNRTTKQWAADNTWDEIATLTGIGASTSASFTLPLFDTEYYATGAASGSPTVKSSNGDMVIAPGTNNAAGVPVRNTNKRSPGESWKAFVFKNNSEVAVTYRLEFLPSSISALARSTNPFEITTYLDGPSPIHLGTTYLHWNNVVYNTIHGGNFQMRDTKTGPHPKVLQPGEQETLYFDLSWWYYWNGSGANAATGIDHSDEGDTALGKSSAQTSGGIWVEPKFLLTVEQAD